MPRIARLTSLMAATAILAATTALSPAIYAGVSTAESYSIDLSDLDIDTLETNYLSLRQDLAANQAEAEQLQSLLNAGSTSVTQAEITALKATITQQQSKATAFETLLAQAKNTTPTLYKLKEDYIEKRQQMALNQAKLDALKTEKTPQYDKISELTALLAKQKAETAALSDQIAKIEKTQAAANNNTNEYYNDTLGGISSGSNSSSGGGMGEGIQNAITASLMQQLMGNGGMPGMPNLSGMMQNAPNTSGTPLTMFAGDQSKTETNRPKTEAEKKREEEKEKKAKRCQPKGSGTTDTEPGKAKDDRISTGGSDTASNPGKAADDKVTKDENEECTEIDVGAKEPESKETGTDTADGEAPNKYGLDTKEKIDKFIADRNGRSIGKNEECAAWPRTEIQHSTAAWRQGDPVTRENSPPVGTWIATFNNGDKYGTNDAIYGKSKFSHTGMFYGWAPDGSIMIADQFNGSGLKVRKWSCSNAMQGCNSYHTIRTPSNGSNLFNHPFFQQLQFAFTFSKSYNPLLKS